MIKKSMFLEYKKKSNNNSRNYATYTQKLGTIAHLTQNACRTLVNAVLDMQNDIRDTKLSEENLMKKSFSSKHLTAPKVREIAKKRNLHEMLADDNIIISMAKQIVNDNQKLNQIDNIK